MRRLPDAPPARSGTGSVPRRWNTAYSGCGAPAVHGPGSCSNSLAVEEVSPPCRAFAEPCASGPVGSRLVLDSLVVEEVHHGRWTFGVCWDSPWYQTMPDQLVLRLRRIGITATLSMRDTS